MVTTIHYNGTYVASRDMPAGTYTNDGQYVVGPCIWEVDRGGVEVTGGIGNNRLWSADIQPGDVFKTQRCGAWTNTQG